MTGFGRGASAAGATRVVAEVRSVNHKYADVRVSLPQELACLGEELEAALRTRFARGRVEATVRLDGPVGGGVSLDKELARSVLVALEELRKELGLTEPPSVSALAALPLVFQQVSTPDGGEALRAAARDAVDQALEAAEAMRRAEGGALARDFDARLALLEAQMPPMRALAAEVAPAALERLQARILRLLEGTPGGIDEARLAQEAAMLADRADVAEELTRLDSHLAQFRAIAAEEGPVGRRLEFLLQEMGREASTIGAKAQDARLQHMVVDLRGEIARMREQVHNIE